MRITDGPVGGPAYPDPSACECLQCGQSISSSNRFCCFGCETVYQLLRSDGLPVELSPQAPQKDWGYLADPSFSKKIDLPEPGYLAKFFLENVHCASCLWVIERMARLIPEVQNTHFNMSESFFSVQVAETEALPKVASLLEAMGFTPHPIRDTSDLEALKRDDLHGLQRRLGVAAFCSGNIMLLSVSVYGGLTGFLRPYFDWISFALFLPVAIYSSRDFMRNSWLSLKQRRPSIDWPIALAVALGGGLSFINLIRGNGTIYFDSLSALVALLLGARLYLRSIQKKFLKGSHLREFLAGQKVLVKQGSLWKAQNADSLAKSQVFQLSEGQRVPVDATLNQDQSTLDPSALTGESLPKSFTYGDSVAAGFRTLEKKTELVATSTVDTSTLGQTLLEAQEQLQAKTKVAELTDRVAHWFTLGILLVASGVFLTFAFSDMNEAIHRALAVVIISCPCALAFAAPLIHSLALNKGQKNGLLIKSASTLEHIFNARKVVLDKTGTLTSNRLRVHRVSGPHVNAENLALLLSLEQKSFHPIARAITRHLSNNKDLQVVELREHREVAGFGVEALFKKEKYSVCSTEDGAVGLFKGKELLLRVELETEVLQDAKETVSALLARGLKLEIASGDHPDKVLQVAQELEIENYHAHLKPKDKTDLLEEGTVMVGDGINDLHSLSASSVGIAVNGALLENIKVADVYLVDPGLTPLRTLFNLADLSRQVLYSNILFSVLYNVIGAGFALSGMISPLIAAALMPLSSSLVVLSSLIGMRKEVR